MTDEPKDPPPPKRRRKPPASLDGFDTGFLDAPADEPVDEPVDAPSAPVRSERGPAADRSEAAPPTPTIPTIPASPAIPTSPTSPTIPTPDRPAPDHPAPAIPRVDSDQGATASGTIDDPRVFAALGASGPIEPTPAALDDVAALADAAAPSARDTEASSSVAAAEQVSIEAWHTPAEEPLLPPVSSEDELREAVGASPAKRRREPPVALAGHGQGDGHGHGHSHGHGHDGDDDHDDDDRPDRPRNRKMIAVAVGSLVVGLGIAAAVFLGRQNSGWFYVACQADQIVAQQGRAFPPWGAEALEGKEWKPIKIPPEAECTPLESESYTALIDQYRAMLVKRATVLLTASEVTKVDEAANLLEQALLLARSDRDASRDARAEIQRLLGDVVYWRASAKLRDASTALTEAAKQFDAAAAQRPRHVSDASAWATYVRELVEQLRAGPSGNTQVAFPPAPSPSERPPAPPGVALPVEPEPAGSASEPAPATPPDAGVPTGGVLL